MAPGVSGDDRAVEKGEMILQTRSCVSEELLENRAHSQHGGAAIYHPVIYRARMHFAPRICCAFQ